MNSSCRTIFITLLNVLVLWLNIYASSERTTAPSMKESLDDAASFYLSSPSDSERGCQKFGSRNSAFSRYLSSETALATPAAMSNLLSPVRFSATDDFYRVSSVSPEQNCLLPPTCFGDSDDVFAPEIDLMISEVLELMCVADASIIDNLNRYLGYRLEQLEADGCHKSTCIMAIKKLYASIETYSNTNEHFVIYRTLLYDYRDTESFLLYNSLIDHCERANNYFESKNTVSFDDVVDAIALDMMFLWFQKPLVFYDLNGMVEMLKSEDRCRSLNNEFWTGLKILFLRD